MIYDFRCDSCGRDDRDVWQRMNDPAPECCGHSMRRAFNTPPQVNAFFFGSTKNPGYQCVVSDRWIDTKTKRNDVMKEFGVSPVEGPPRFAPQG
jgi:putative FmdB family regulatory protein